MSDEGSNNNDPNGQGLKFYYNREKRLEHAPESVRLAHEVGYTVNKGFFRGLTANAGLRSVLMVIVILCIVITVSTFLRGSNNSATAEGVKIVLNAFPFEDNVYITLNCKAGAETSSEPVSVIVRLRTIDGAGNTVAMKELGGVYSGNPLELRAIMNDYELKSVKATVIFNKTEIQLTAAVDRK